MAESTANGIATSDLSTPQSQCGCKGARYCKMCRNSERVKNLERGPRAPVPVEQPWRQFTPFMFCARCAHAVPIDVSSEFDLNRLEELAKSTASQSCDEHSAAGAESKDGAFRIGGLTHIEDFISEDDERYLCEIIARQNWVVSQSGRRKQDYGPRVNFKHHKVKLDSFVGMPEYADFVLQRMHSRCADVLSDYQPFEMCNLEYNPERGSSIDFHVDDTWIWGNRLISINLMAGAVMSLVQESSQRIIFIVMPRRSLLCMADECRYEWKHGILAEHIREHRIALTMREPAEDFQLGGALYEQYGKRLIEISNQRVTTTATS